MTTNNPSQTPPVETLNDEALTEIEARLGRSVELDLLPDVRALCQSLRAAWAERLEIQRVLASAVLEDPTEDDDPPYSTTELVEGVRWLLYMKEAKQARVTALREQLAEAQRQLAALQQINDAAERERHEAEAKLAQTQSERDEARQHFTRQTERLAQMEKERDQAKEDVRLLMRDKCVEKVREMEVGVYFRDVEPAANFKERVIDTLSSLTLDSTEQREKKES